MNKNAIKKFAIDARNKLIASVTDKAGMLGITPDNCSEAITKGADFEVYKTAAGTEVTLNKKQCEQRRKLVAKIYEKGFESVVEEVAYTWFNRICAIRFMEVNDYMYPVRVRVLSSEKEGKNEPDVVTMAPDIDWNFTDKEREEIIDAKMNNRLDDLFRMLFIKQCNLLHEVLPGLFEETEDYTEMLLNISFTNEDDVIRMLIDEKRGIPEEDFNVNTIGEDGQPTGQVEIIGWLYQYYNTELKDDTFAKLKKNVKITKERIPAATQLFTPDWIVRYMVENSVGRIWIEHLRAVDPSTDEKATAEKFGWKYYLPEAEQEEAVNVKLAEIRTTYKDLKPTDITCIDPCMGSGHILIAMFDVLMDIYESAGYDKREAAFDIVENNIHGLDIDQRAYQLAYFAVMMKGRGYNRRFLRGRDEKPEPKVYAIVESNLINRNHLQFFGTHLSDTERNLAVIQIEGLLDDFKDAREYGSILNIDDYNWNVLNNFVADLDTNGQISFESVGSEETQESLLKIVSVGKNLGQKYKAVVTNPPYMSNKGMNEKLNIYVQNYYNNVKNDMFAVFIKKCQVMTNKNGIYSLITQPSILNLSSFAELRRELITSQMIVSLLQMGRGIFGIDFGSTAFVVRKSYLMNYIGEYFKLYKRIFQFIEIDEIKQLYLSAKNDKEYTFDFSKLSSEEDSEEIGGQIIRFQSKQDDFMNVPNQPIAFTSSRLPILYKNAKLLGECAYSFQGIITGNNNYYLRLWHELNFNSITLDKQPLKEDGNDNSSTWIPYNKGGDYRKWYGNNEYVMRWEKNGKELTRARTENRGFYFREGITWSFICSRKFSARWFPKGYLWDVAGSSIFDNGGASLEEIVGLLNSSVGEYLLSISNPTINFQVENIISLPYIASDYTNAKEKVRKCIELCKNNWDSKEISWDFKKHPLIKLASYSIKEAYENYRMECNNDIKTLKALEEQLNRFYAELYGLEEEVKITVSSEDVTIEEVNLRELVQSFISYAVGCMFGRYSLDEEGLIYAGGKWDCGRYKTFLSDNDNCIPITDEEYFSDDIVTRFVEFVKTVYGADTLDENLDFIANALGTKGDTSREVIRNYFLKDFYTDHLKVYQKRPIYWLFDSGKQNGFKALIYMHRYDADTVGRVRTDYLHKAQKYVETAMQSAQYTIDNATSSSEKSKATKAVAKYTKQLAEMKIYDEAIAHVANQRIEIDLDDGVKVNYAKFQGVEVAQEGKKALKVDLLAKI